MRSITRRNGVLIIAAMVCAVLFLSVPGQQMWRKVLQDAGHGPVFAVISVVLVLMRPVDLASRSRAPRVLLQSFLIAVAIGVLTELIQHFQPGRTMSLRDVAHDAAGAALGLALLAIIERRPSPAVRRGTPGFGDRATSPASGRGDRASSGRGVWAWVAVLGSLSVLAWQPLECANAYARRSTEFPVLMQGARAADLYFTSCYRCELSRKELPARYVTERDTDAIHVQYNRQDRPRLELFEPMPDWRGRHRLKIDLTNPSAVPLQVALKVQDAEHNQQSNDRLNLYLVLAAASRTTIDVPLTTIESAPVRRRMDLAHMANVALFTFGPAGDGEFYVSRVWLE